MTQAEKAVLFDLDGTLIDSAPDLAAAGNEMRVARGLDPLPYEVFRPMVGSGARGMVAIALEASPKHPDYEALRSEFLDRYSLRMTQETVVFQDVGPLLERLKTAGVPCGIVTNKATRFAEPLIRALGLERAVSVLVCGDTTPHSKPHPAPLLEAARCLQVEPAFCVYVGDDLRDVQAGQAAGMMTVISAWGYLGTGEPIDRWGADHIIATPGELLKLLSMA